MKIQKLYQKIIYPLNIITLCATVIFFVAGVTNLLGSSGISGSSSAFDNGRVVLKSISPVEKKIGLSGDIILKPELNPFTSDHNDWVVAKKKSNKKESDLNLEVCGIIVIRSKAKAILKDMDEKKSATFKLMQGDTYKGYKVAYISKQHIIFTGKGKNLRFALSSGKSKLYSGKGEIFVAPDIDLYIDRLKAEESGESIQPVAQDKTAAEDKTDASAEAKTADRTSTPGAGYGGGSRSGRQTAVGDSSDHQLDNSGGDDSLSDSAGSTREEEMAFIEELKKIFQKGGK